MDFELTAAQAAVQTLARGFAQGRVAPLAREMDEQGQMPLALVDEMGALGLLGGAMAYCDAKEIPQTAVLVDMDPLSLL